MSQKNRQGLIPLGVDHVKGVMRPRPGWGDLPCPRPEIFGGQSLVTTGASPEALLPHVPWLRLPWGLWRLDGVGWGWTTWALGTRCQQL